jgi:signal peptidase I
VTDETAATTARTSIADAPPAGPSAPETANGGAGSPQKKFHVSRGVIEWGILLIAAVILALLIKTFLFQAFYIPSESMVPTLEVGDRVLVNKLSYDLHDVNRGDIVVFEAEPNPGWRNTGIDDLVKRVIALPGETVAACGQGPALENKICIDGRELEESYLPDGTVTDMSKIATTEKYGCADDSPTNGCKVLPGHYFVMGDNRSRSSDAREHGAIKGSSIVGRVFVRIWPLDRLSFM